MLVVTKFREGHNCDFRWTVISLVKWDGIQTDQANKLYDIMGKTLGAHGKSSNRGNGTNKTKSCKCNGQKEIGGASFSFGCSKHLYYKNCKFAKANPDQKSEKFKLDGKSLKEEIEIEEAVHELADTLSLTFKQHVPDAYQNMIGMYHYKPE